MIAIMKACPEADLPSPRPARAFVATAAQGLAAGIHQFRRFGWGQHRAGIEAEEMRHMAVLRLYFLVILQPFQKIALLADLHGREMGFRGTKAIGERRVHAQDLHRLAHCIV